MRYNGINNLSNFYEKRGQKCLIEEGCLFCIFIWMNSRPWILCFLKQSYCLYHLHDEQYSIENETTPFSLIWFCCSARHHDKSWSQLMLHGPTFMLTPLACSWALKYVAQSELLVISLGFETETETHVYDPSLSCASHKFSPPWPHVSPRRALYSLWLCLSLLSSTCWSAPIYSTRSLEKHVGQRRHKQQIHGLRGRLEWAVDKHGLLHTCVFGLHLLKFSHLNQLLLPLFGLVD